jgi:hypothetical protein
MMKAHEKTTTLTNMAFELFSIMVKSLHVPYETARSKVLRAGGFIHHKDTKTRRVGCDLPDHNMLLMSEPIVI